MFYFMQIIGGLIRLVFHVFAVKLPSYRAKCEAGNIPFTVLGYFKCDWLAISTAFITVLIAVYCIDEAIAFYPPIQNWIKFFMIFIGYTGSSVLISLLGRASSSALNIIKTNISVGAETVEKQD